MNENSDEKINVYERLMSGEPITSMSGAFDLANPESITTMLTVALQVVALRVLPSFYRAGKHTESGDPFISVANLLPVVQKIRSTFFPEMNPESAHLFCSIVMTTTLMMLCAQTGHVLIESVSLEMKDIELTLRAHSTEAKYRIEDDRGRAFESNDPVSALAIYCTEVPRNAGNRKKANLK